MLYLYILNAALVSLHTENIKDLPEWHIKFTWQNEPKCKLDGLGLVDNKTSTPSFITLQTNKTIYIFYT